MNKDKLINNKNICNLNSQLSDFNGIEEKLKKCLFLKPREKRTFANFPRKIIS